VSNLSDPTYLKNNQYQDSSNLSARAALHERFSTDKTGWHAWVFQQLQIPTQARILEIGCGPGYFWRKNQPQISSGWRVAMTDLSQGMLKEARTALRDSAAFSYTLLDGGCLPFPESFFDAVLANHVLYHLPAVQPALQEIHRVLKKGGTLYAATNGEGHLREIREWEKRFLPENDPQQWGTITTSFNLENGAHQLQAFFNPVQRRLHPGQLEINQAPPVLQYIESYYDQDGAREPLARLRAYLEEVLQEKGSLTVSKETGLFLAKKP